MLSRMWHEFWLILFAALIGVGVFAGAGMLIGFGAMGLLITGAGWLWNRVSLEDVSYKREFTQQRVFIGEKASMRITLTNRKPLPLSRALVEDEMPASMDLVDADVVGSPNPEAKTLRHSTSMSWYERIRWTYEFTCRRRGYFRVGPATLKSGDIFGFFGSEKIIRSQDYVLVYPRVVSLPEIGMPSARPLGETRGGIRIFEDASRPMGLRDYRTGDPLKIVDWKATARMQDLQVRTFEPSSSLTVILAVAVDTVAHTWEGYSPIHLERIITAAASIANYAAGQRCNLGSVLQRHAHTGGQTAQDSAQPSAGAADRDTRSACVHTPAARGIDRRPTERRMAALPDGRNRGCGAIAGVRRTAGRAAQHALSRHQRRGGVCGRRTVSAAA